jgi:hypothetical protein
MEWLSLTRKRPLRAIALGLMIRILTEANEGKRRGVGGGCFRASLFGEDEIGAEDKSRRGRAGGRRGRNMFYKELLGER